MLILVNKSMTKKKLRWIENRYQ